jgi:hypothetical protein
MTVGKKNASGMENRFSIFHLYGYQISNDQWKINFLLLYLEIIAATTRPAVAAGYRAAVIESS